MKTIKQKYTDTMDTIREEFSDIELIDEEPFDYESPNSSFDHESPNVNESIVLFTEPEIDYTSFPFNYAKELIKAFHKPRTQYIFCVNEFINHKTGLAKTQTIYAHYLIENIRYLGYKLLNKMHSLHFNRKGNYLCGSSAIGEAVVLHAWPNLEWSMKFDFAGAFLTDAHLLHYANCTDVILVTEDGELLHASLLPNGDMQLNHAYDTVSVEHLVVNPQAENEIISIGWDKDIHLTDTREKCSYIVNKNSTDKIGMLHVAHHPLQPEICVCGENNYTYVYDKRNMNSAIHKVGLSNVWLDDFYADTCEYNFLGTEILVNYNKEIADVYANIASDTPSEQLHRIRSYDDWSSANFMGFTSEYIVTTHGGSYGKYNHIYFWDKKTEALVNFHYFHSVEQVAVHPNEYVVSFINNLNDVELLFPSFINDKPLTLESMFNRYGPTLIYDEQNSKYFPFHC